MMLIILIIGIEKCYIPAICRPKARILCSSFTGMSLPCKRYVPVNGGKRKYLEFSIIITFIINNYWLPSPFSVCRINDFNALLISCALLYVVITTEKKGCESDSAMWSIHTLPFVEINKLHYYWFINITIKE